MDDTPSKRTRTVSPERTELPSNLPISVQAKQSNEVNSPPPSSPCVESHVEHSTPTSSVNILPSSALNLGPGVSISVSGSTCDDPSVIAEAKKEPEPEFEVVDLDDEDDGEGDYNMEDYTNWEGYPMDEDGNMLEFDPNDSNTGLYASQGMYLKICYKYFCCIFDLKLH